LSSSYEKKYALPFFSHGVILFSLQNLRLKALLQLEKLGRQADHICGNMPSMDLAGVIWITFFGIVIGGGALTGGIFIYRIIYHLIKSASSDD
jgi:hypothetical protein